METKTFELHTFNADGTCVAQEQFRGTLRGARARMASIASSIASGSVALFREDKRTGNNVEIDGSNAARGPLSSAERELGRLTGEEDVDPNAVYAARRVS